MSGRRSHARFAVLQSPVGVLRVLRDIDIQSSANGDIVAVSREPGVLGELVSVQFPAHPGEILRARVLESQPVVRDGSVRHQLRLHHVTDERLDDEAGSLTERGIGVE
jgi:hypothetical protein